MLFPITDLLDEQECYNYLLHVLHPNGLCCQLGHPLPQDQAPHDRSRSTILKYKCRICSRVFNLFTRTVWSGTRYSCVQVVLIMRGFVQGHSTNQVAGELDLDYSNLLRRRHQIQQLGLERQPKKPLLDQETEADEMFQNAGEKGTPHQDKTDPPRRRASKRKGKGTMDNDRPPVMGIVGRTTGQVRLHVCDNTRQVTIEPKVETGTIATTNMYTDESSAYAHIAKTGRGHATVCHSAKEWARDDDGDGIREVHCNTMEGIWTGLRNFLRTFRGVHKKYLPQYVAMFEWSHNLKRVNSEFLRTLIIPHFTCFPT
ncbi:IS1595 family transposase [Chroococcidiopsis sp. CCMEE 29]|uniref:IS1595 family transposase n=1 Tax=Chroococcidiopsis sp. CCMEE 29 TaxID=155894 RepID=UPI0020220A8D|nr:IS1595 family transposase [Chroococcidiopsis sp. CCMEE 29]